MPARLDLAGARILLTGASAGIGHALALRLAERRARLVVASRNQQRLDALAAEVRGRGGEAHAVPADVADAAQRRRLLDATLSALGGLDILINNAGIGAMGWFGDSSEELLRRVFEVNFFGTTELTRLALPHLRKGHNPMLVNVSSAIGRRALPGCAEYCASKFAMSGWTESLRPELARHGIHVLLVSPGAVVTEFRANLVEDRLRFPWQTGKGMTADQCARRIVEAMRKKKREVVITLQAKFLLLLNRLWPGLVDHLLTRFARPVQEKSP